MAAKKQGRRYPWELWFSKDKFVLYPDKDFNGRAYSFAVAIRQNARKYGVKVRVTVDEDGKWVRCRVLERYEDTTEGG